jgi:SagB-type dehydrogenase family enzyme
MTRLRHDLDFLISIGLLATAVATAATGIVADLWDLNDFWYHTVAGYVGGAFAIAHVWLNWGRLTGYARFRLIRRPTRSIDPAALAPRSVPRPAGPAHEPEPIGAAGRLERVLVSRRLLIGAAAGGAIGLVLGHGLRPLPPIPAGSDVGVIYHQWSKPGLIDALGSVANWGQQPELYKSYPEASRVVLVEPRLDGGLSATEAIAGRRSSREYSGEPMTPDELSRLLFLTSGISADRFGNARRTAPSSGALYPIEVYVVVHRVAGVDPGAYHYDYRGHALELVRPGDLRTTVVDQGIGQEFLGQCNVVLFLTQILQRMRPKYQDRAYRYGLLEAGHIGENAYLAARSMGLGACGIGAFLDDGINEMLRVDGVEEAVVYMLAAGHVRTA